MLGPTWSVKRTGAVVVATRLSPQPIRGPDMPFADRHVIERQRGDLSGNPVKVGSAEGAGLAGSEDGGADEDGAVAGGEAVTGSVGEAVGVAVALVVAGWVCEAVGAAEFLVGVGAGGPKQPASANMAPTPRR